jgi:triosephosphate isomerase
MRIPFVAGNWKMFKTVSEAVKYVADLRGLVSGIDDVEIVVAPVFTALHAAAEAARGRMAETVEGLRTPISNVSTRG